MISPFGGQVQAFLTVPLLPTAIIFLLLFLGFPFALLDRVKLTLFQMTSLPSDLSNSEMIVGGEVYITLEDEGTHLIQESCNLSGMPLPWTQPPGLVQKGSF